MCKPQEMGSGFNLSAYIIVLFPQEAFPWPWCFLGKSKSQTQCKTLLSQCATKSVPKVPQNLLSWRTEWGLCTGIPEQAFLKCHKPKLISVLWLHNIMRVSRGPMERGWRGNKGEVSLLWRWGEERAPMPKTIIGNSLFWSIHKETTTGQFQDIMSEEKLRCF